MNLVKFIDQLRKTLYEAGEIAVYHQGKVKNLKKTIESFQSDSEFARPRRTAKTIVDTRVQEMLLRSIANVMNPASIYIDAEETSKSKSLFSKKATDYTLIIDPIDGTMDYIAGRENYNISVGLLKEGNLVVSFIYFPSRKELYFNDDNDVYYEKSQLIKKMISPVKVSKKNIYVNNRVSKKILKSLKERGFSVTDDRTLRWPDALIDCIKGKFKACIFHSPSSKRCVAWGVDK